MAKILKALIFVALGAALSAGGIWRYSGEPATELRWSNEADIAAQKRPSFTELVDKDKSHRWDTPSVTVYSAPYSPPRPSPVTLKDLSDNGQAHAIDVVFKGPETAKTAWQELMNTVSASAGGVDRVDPYRVNRVLIATVAKGLDTLPGDRLLWTRVFVQPINFEFAGYNVAATDSRSFKIASIENSTNTKLSVSGGADPGLPGITKPDAGQTIEKTQKATADVTEQYENLGIDIQQDFLRIIRESAPGGDVAGNAAVQLSMVTDPSKIWCASANESFCKPSPPLARSAGGSGDDQDADDGLVLRVSNTHLDEGETNPRMSVLPQNALPHCPLIANVWMLYEIRNITKGRQNYVEGMQQVELSKEGYNAGKVQIVPADDIAPAVWSIKVTDAADRAPVVDDKPDLTGQVEHARPRRLVFTDYLTASELAHWLKTKMATGDDPTVGKMKFNVDPGKTLTPFKHVTDDCHPLTQSAASR